MSLDSASIRSHSVASFHSAPEVDDSDETSDENENGLVIDDETYVQQGEDIVQLSQTENKNCSLPKRDPDSNNRNKLKENCVDDSSDASAVSEAESSRGVLQRKGVKNNVDIICDLPADEVSRNTSFTTLGSKVPSDLSDSMCCDEAIDYSLPKPSGAGGAASASDVSCHMSNRISNLSHSSSTSSKLGLSLDSAHRHAQTNKTIAAINELEQTPQKISTGLSKPLPRSCPQHSSVSTRIISSPTKPLVRNVSTLKESLATPSSPHKRLKPNSDHPKPHILVPASQDMRSKVTRRLRLQEVEGVTRCGSAPPTTSTSYLKPLKFGVFPVQDSLSSKEVEFQERIDNSNDHSLGKY